MSVKIKKKGLIKFTKFITSSTSTIFAPAHPHQITNTKKDKSKTKEHVQTTIYSFVGIEKDKKNLYTYMKLTEGLRVVDDDIIGCIIIP